MFQILDRSLKYMPCEIWPVLPKYSQFYQHPPVLVAWCLSSTQQRACTLWTSVRPWRAQISQLNATDNGWLLCIIWRCEECLGFQIWFVTEFRCEINQSSALPWGQLCYNANKVLILQPKRAYSCIRLLILLTDVYCPPIKLHFSSVSTK